jgi:hypothetical protein
MRILLKRGMFGGARRRTSRIKKMNSLLFEGNMWNLMRNTVNWPRKPR